MFRYQIKVEYDGTDFVGWQYQKNGKSVQGVLQKILLQFLKKKLLLWVLAERIQEFMLLNSLPI